MKLPRLRDSAPSLRRYAFSIALLAAGALIAWVLLGPSQPAPALKKVPAVTPAREQPMERPRRSLDPELVSSRAPGEAAHPSAPA